MALGLDDQLELGKQLQKQRQQSPNENAAKKPQPPTAIAVTGKLILKGIYKLAGDKLTYCVSAAGASRPAGFAIEKGSGQTLVHLERFTTGEADIEAALTLLGARLSHDEVGYITTVNFRNTQVEDDDLKLLKQLQKLTQVSLGDTAITDAGLLHLKEIKLLRDLHLNGTRITDNGLAHLKNHDLRTLYLSDTKITDAGLLHLRKFDKLYNLHLSRTRVTDDGMRTVRDLPGLDSVFLEGTDITDAGVAYLVRHPKLSGVRLAGTRITDAAVQQLATLPHLGNLSLGGTQTTDASLGYLQKARKLWSLSLARPQIDTRVIDAKAQQRRAGVQTSGNVENAGPQFSAQAIRDLQELLPELKIQRDR